jgi:chromosome segregation ATPase
MKEMDRANLSFNKKNTQTTSQLMSLTMMCDAPYRRLRQVLAQIENKRFALEDSAFELRKKKVELRNLREKDDELSQIEADEIENQIKRSMGYIEGSLKELAMYQDAYDEIKESFGIPDKWDEVDFEKEEISNHIRMAFRNCLRNVMVTGGMNMGTMEYLEQFGIHPVTAKKLIMDYLSEVEKMVDNKKYPSVTHLYDFLDRCADIFQDAHYDVMARIGIKDLLKDEYLFKELKDVS